jgi:serine/threonine protein kinase
LSCNAFKRPRGFAGTPAYCSPGLKKFLKEGHHWRCPHTDAFKDDVYSFALTSAEVIKHRFSIEECPREITDLLDEMLNIDERERPTFRHLLYHATVQKYLES